jgi:membrane protein YqaA with SNARE-associated domain
VGFLKQLNQYLLVMGIPGLFAIALLDSAAVPMAGGPDAVVMLLAWQRPTLLPAIALAAALGSMIGCLVLYGIGRKGGVGVMARFGPERQAWVRRKMEQYGVGAVILAVLAPPPFPTKPVILAAGVLQTSRFPFALAVLGGRVARYSFAGYLGARFGDQAAAVLKQYYPAIGLGFAAAVLLLLAVRRIPRKKNRS